MECKPLIDHVVGLAMDVSTEDAVDFGMLSIDEESAYRLIASSMIELYGINEENLNEVTLTLLGTVTHLVVKNMALEMTLLGKMNK